MNSHPTESRLSELMADLVLFGLGPEEEEELQSLSSFSEELDDSFEIAAAVVDLSMIQPEPMPEALEQRLARQGRAVLQTGQGLRIPGEMPRQPSNGDLQGMDPSPSTIAVNQPVRPTNRDASAPSALDTSSDQNSGSRIREVIAWACAAGIGFVALLIWNDKRESVSDLKSQVASLRDGTRDLESNAEQLTEVLESMSREFQVIKSENEELTQTNTQLAQQVDTLTSTVVEYEQKLNSDPERFDPRELYNRLASRDDVVKWNWAPAAKDKSRAQGDIVWDQRSQTGAMRFVNLEVNDPLTQQYQLWIIEAETDRKHPVDGGVFNANSDGEIYIPIDAKLLTTQPKAFAITAEKPTGVVVSEQNDVRLIAAAPPTDGPPAKDPPDDQAEADQK